MGSAMRNNKEATVSIDGDVAYIRGPLNFHNVMPILKQTIKHIDGSNKTIFDFTSLVDSDSSGVALVIEWIKYAERHKKDFRIKGLPRDLMVLIETADLNKLVSRYLLG